MAIVRRAAIDLGTNTCLLLMVEWDSAKNAIHSIIGDDARVVRLGQGVDHHQRFQDEAMERAINCLRQYWVQTQQNNIPSENIICVATSQARDAKNSRDFFDRIRLEIGLIFKILSGDDEAHYTFAGALLPNMDPQSSVVIDIGGGSTEIVSTSFKKSVDCGAVRFTERYFSGQDPVTDHFFWTCQEAIDSALTAFLPWRGKVTFVPSLVAVAGTATSLASWYLQLETFDPKKIDGLILTQGDVHRMVEELKWRTNAERQLLPCMDPMRADVILAGALILWRAMETLQFAECRVSTRGLRFGALLKTQVPAK